MNREMKGKRAEERGTPPPNANAANNCLGLAIAQDNCTSYVDVNCFCAK